MKKLPIYVSLDFLIKFYAEMDKLKKSDKQADENLFVLAMSFSQLLMRAELYFPKSDIRFKSVLASEDSPRLKNILKNAKNLKDYESALSNIDNLKTTVQNDPHAIFLIDEIAESHLDTWGNLQNRFGVICFKHSHWKDKAEFLLNWALFSVGKNLVGSKLPSWKTLEKFRHPCNAMVIAENYILDKKEEIDDNLLPLMDSLLPKEKLDIPFQITFIVQWDGNESPQVNKTNLDKIFNYLKPQIESLRTDFNFELQVFCVNKELNHDRNIITNYLWLHSGHSFSYFKNENNTIRTIKDTNLMVFPTTYQQKEYQSYSSNTKIISNSIFEAVQVLLEQAKKAAKTRDFKETPNAKNRLLS